MLIQQGATRTNAHDIRLACTLAAVAGALNAAAFYAVGFFSANMTGNISTLSSHIATGAWVPAAFCMAIVCAFILGAVSSTLIISAGHRRAIPGVYALVILVEAGLMGILGGVDIWFLPHWRAPVLIVGLAFLMGLQNAVVTRISDARVRTTHVSGMATDIGIELALLIDVARGRESHEHLTDVTARLRLHLETILSFCLGGIVGVIVYRAIGGGLLWLCASTLAIIAFSALRRSRRAANGRTADSSVPPNDL